MTIETIRILVSIGFFMMLLFLRLEASRFGAAEYDEPGMRRVDPATRLSWYAIGFALLAAIYFVHPAPHDVLFLLVGHTREVVFYGAILALPGLLQAAAFAWLRYGDLRLPPLSAYPGAAVNSIATAVIDEAAFRGVLLGALVAVGVPDGQAILLGTVVYVLATRLAAPGHHPYPVLLAGAMGLAFGWATLASGGIGAAIIGHVVTAFAVFVCTGHAGQVPLVGLEPEDLERRTGLPEGWQDARRPLSPGRGAEPRDFGEAPGPSGFNTRAGRNAPPVRHSGGLMKWARAASRSVAPRAGRRPR
jgi:membrane protease YdiL (CAAX protease family)